MVQVKNNLRKRRIPNYLSDKTIKSTSCTYEIDCVIILLGFHKYDHFRCHKIPVFIKIHLMPGGLPW